MSTIGKKNKRYVGSVGVYLLREVSDEVWETIVHRRSARVSSSPNLLATPGGFVEKKDAVDEMGIMQESIMFRRGMQREVLEETDFCIDSIDPSDVFELPSVPGNPSTHKNFGIILKTSLACAKPQHGFEWEMTPGGVEDIGSPIPGGFHSWVSLSDLLQRSDVMPECRHGIEMLFHLFKHGVSSACVSGPSSSTDSVAAFVNDSTDSVSARVGGVSRSLSAAAAQDSCYGEREWHSKPGTYVTPQFDAWAGHYSWPCNVFGNQCFYGVGFRVLHLTSI